MERVGEQVRFDPAEPVRVPIAEQGSLRVVLFCLEEGQEIPRHTAAATVLMQAFSGEGVLVSGEEAHEAKAGDLVVVPPMVPHAMKAPRGRFTILACIVSAAG